MPRSGEQQCSLYQMQQAIVKLLKQYRQRPFISLENSLKCSVVPQNSMGPLKDTDGNLTEST